MTNSCIVLAPSKLSKDHQFDSCLECSPEMRDARVSTIHQERPLVHVIKHGESCRALVRSDTSDGEPIIQQQILSPDEIRRRLDRFVELIRSSWSALRKTSGPRNRER